VAIYIIEHLEPELYEWCLIEYENISKIVGKKRLWFTSVKHTKDRRALSKFGKAFSESIRDMKLDNDKVCVLDPEVDETLTPFDAKKFDFFVFGGILGDYPPRKRTKDELTKFLPECQKRNIGKEQFSTDNAVKVVSLIEKGKRFEDLEFQNGATIKINKIESVDLPFFYYVDKGKPFISGKIVSYLKRKKYF